MFRKISHYLMECNGSSPGADMGDDSFMTIKNQAKF